LLLQSANTSNTSSCFPILLSSVMYVWYCHFYIQLPSTNILLPSHRIHPSPCSAFLASHNYRVSTRSSNQRSLSTKGNEFHRHANRIIIAIKGLVAGWYEAQPTRPFVKENQSIKLLNSSLMHFRVLLCCKRRRTPYP